MSDLRVSPANAIQWDAAWASCPHGTAFHSFDPDAAASHVPGARPDTTQAISLSPGFDAVFHIWSKEHRAIINQAHRPGAGPGDESGEEGP